MKINRRDFVRATAVGAAVVVPQIARAQQSGVAAPVDLAEWSYFWLGVERATLMRGTVHDGMHMFVEYAIPREVKYPFPVVLVHGGAGQGLDWMTTPDGRPGWAHYLLQAGYMVYVLDRPAQGRPAWHPYLHGNFPRQAPTAEEVAKILGADVNDPAVGQLLASFGPALPANARSQEAWKRCTGKLLEEIGPSVIVTHGDGQAFGAVAQREFPALVKGLYAADASGSNFAGAYSMLGKNNHDTLQPVLDWTLQFAPSGTPVPPRSAASKPVSPQPGDSTAMKLADMGHFWVGVQPKQMPYGTIATGQMFVQYFIPAVVTKPYPIVMVHGGGGQSTHFMGIGRRPGWMHFFIQQGYRVYVVDRPGFGRSPYHPDSLGPSQMQLFPTYDGFANAPAVMNTVRWPGNHIVGQDPLVDQFMANEIGNASDEVYHSQLCGEGGVELLDRIGPSVVLGHAFGGFLSWIMADRRPELVKGIVSVEINGNPFLGQLKWGVTAIPLAYDPPVSELSEFQLVDTPVPPDSPRTPLKTFKLQAEPAHKLKNLQKIPMAWLTGEFGGGGLGYSNVAFLKQAGCQAELIRLRDLGINGNGNLMPMETNNREVYDVIAKWLDKNVV